MILPGAAYTEKDGIYVNTEGRPQLARRASSPPGEAREDWKILRALSDYLGGRLPYDTPAQLRERIVAAWPHLGKFDEIAPAAWGPFGEKGPISGDPLVLPIADFYQTNAICRASNTMKQCSATLLTDSTSHAIAEAAE